MIDLLTFSDLKNALLFSGVLCFMFYATCNSIGIFRFKCIVTWCLRQYLHSCFQHCVKSVRIQIFFWAVFSCIQSEYRKIRTRNNSIFGHFSRSAILTEYHKFFQYSIVIFQIKLLKIIYDISHIQKVSRATWKLSNPAFTCSELTVETLEQCLKSVQS